MTSKESLDLDPLLVSGGELPLVPLNLATKLLDGLLVLGGILATLFLELLENPIQDPPVEVLSAQVSVSASCHNLEDAIVDCQEGNIEGSASKVKHQDVLLALALVVKAVGDCRGSGLIDDPQHIETSNGAGILGSLALGVIEVCWHSDNSVLELAAQIRFGSLLHLGQNHRRDLLRREG
mmetsp:Transcript_1850/g.2973  ORF Transcript_1850/g.2973 Transcript_1850/m.2973 type:complete len:180 (+) Transcript_1850:1093-1632(+)